MTVGEPEHQLETGFGTGLRGHLHRAEPASPPPPERAPAHAPGGPDIAELEARSLALRTAAQALEERERRLAESRRELAAETERLGTEQAALDRLTVAQGKPVPAVLRERAERHVERLWQSLFGALDATRPDGSADFPTRVSAARALLAAAYRDGEAAGAGLEPGEDQLARLRARRAEPGLW
jgi:hypothetical protein